MTLTLGRVTLSAPLGVPFKAAGAEVGSVGGTTSVRGFSVEGREVGTTAQTTMAAYEKETKRIGHLYASDTGAAVPSGYYRLVAGASYEKPGGRPNVRPWSFDLVETDAPTITRQAEDDDVAGTVTADVSGDVDEDAYVAYTPTTSFVSVLDPDTVAGAEPVNLPTGDWKIVARVYCASTITAVVRARTKDLASAVLVTGADKSVATANQWTELVLGTFTVATANDKANWYEIQVKDPTNTNSVRLDRVRIVPA